MEFLVVWLALCSIPAIIASRRGRSAFGWFAFSALISPLLGGIIVACLKPMSAALEQQALASGSMRKCPRCAELVKAEATICRYCQQDLPSMAAPEPAPLVGAIRVPRKPDVCPQCGRMQINQLTKTAARCATCRAVFEFS